MAWYNGTDTFSEIDIVLLSTRSNQKNSRYTGILYGIIYGVVWCNQRRREKIIFEKVFMVLGLAKGKVQFSKEERRRENTTTNTRTQHAVIETWLLDPLTKNTTNKIINFPWTVMAMQKIFSERAEVRSHTLMTRSVSIVKFQLSRTFRRPIFSYCWIWLCFVLFFLLRLCQNKTFTTLVQRGGAWL